MIWQATKIALFLLVVVGIAFAADVFIGTGEIVRLSFRGREISMTTPVLALGVVAALVGVWLLLYLAGLAIAVIAFFSGDETAISRYLDRNRERRGFDALARGMVALAVGEAREASVQAGRAERDLKRPELTNLINAQAAELSGNRTRAEEYYKQLLGDGATRVIGVRGLMKQKLEDGDTETALKLAEKALELRPRHGETISTLLKLQLEQEDWAGARKTLLASVRAKNLPRAIAKRREAVVALADARRRLESDDTSGASKAAAEANRLSPSLIPAAVLAARFEKKKGNARKAEAILRKAWSANPHPDLATAFAAIRPDETPTERLRRFQQLLKLNPSFEETRLLKAELLLAAEDLNGARKALGSMAEEEPTVRSLAIMGAIAKSEGSSEQVVRGWLTRALSAPGGARWICESCSHVHSSWAAVCENCKAFDAMSWKTPKAGSDSGDSTPVLALQSIDL
ncbi:MAG: tetratricopeptide repeat protein [Rhodobacteraceae bacterium]|nr:tetratricopeptide repeat protein [Paracoccaceae bacterium]MCY4140974.1 tetratricopeptide repeat protein [Paracoccaceae bacterium]